MTKWNAFQYLRYGSERTRAAADLVARINLDAPQNIADVGCGPGNSTSLLWQRWPRSNVLGIDNSPEMIDAARTTFPERQWSLCCHLAPKQYRWIALQTVPVEARMLMHSVNVFLFDGNTLRSNAWPINWVWINL